MPALMIGLCIQGTALADPPDLIRLKPLSKIPVTQVIPEEYAKIKEAAIVIEKLEHREDQLGMRITMRIINPTKKLLIYRGCADSSPEMRLQLWKDGKWVDSVEADADPNQPELMIRQFLVATGRSVTFEINVTADELPLRIALDCKDNDKKEFTLWSEKLER